MDHDCGDIGSIIDTTEDMEYNKIWSAFNEMRLTNKLCDAVLVASDGKTFPVHKAILAANSCHFLQSLTAAEKKQSPKSNGAPIKPEYISQNIAGEHLEAIIEYMYNRVSRITMGNALSVLEYAEKLDIKGLADQCAIFLSTGLNCYNSIKLWKFAQANNKAVLRDKSRTYILDNFVTISKKNTDFLQLVKAEVDSFIRDDNLNTKSEEAVFESVLRWIDYKPSERAKFIATFLGSIRLGLIGIDYFVENISNHPYIADQLQCNIIIKKAWKFLYDLQKFGSANVSLSNKLIKPRVPRDVLFTLGGWSGGNPISQFETYDTRADRWYEQPDLIENIPRSYYGMALVGNKIYVIGGYDGVMYFNSTRRFNPATKEWTDLSPMYTQRCYVAVAACNGYIYAMGGYDGRWRLNSVECYDPSRNQWTMCKHMISKRSDAGADTIAGKVYVAGGFDGDECLSSVEVFSPETDQWTMCSNMIQARSGISVIAHFGILYAIGGYDGSTRLSTGEKYDPVLKHWESIKSMYASRSNSGIAVIDDMIFVMGGFNGQSTVEHVECYAPEQDEWLDATDMNITRSAFKACVIRGLPNVKHYTYYGQTVNNLDGFILEDEYLD